MWNLLKGNYKDIRTSSVFLNVFMIMSSFWCFCQLWTDFTPCSRIYIAGFEQVNTPEYIPICAFVCTYSVSIFTLVKISIFYFNPLKAQSCELHNNKYMITSTEIANTKIFTFIVAIVFKLMRHEVLFINRKDNRNC